MPMLTCNACNKELKDETEQKIHYKSEWHRYNLKRKVAGVPGVTEALFNARQSALTEERNRMSKDSMLYGCALCGKQYRSSKAHAQHLNSRAHILRASQELNSPNVSDTIIKPLQNRVPKLTPSSKVASMEEDDEDSEDEWEEVDSNDGLINGTAESPTDMCVDDHDEDNEKVDFDPLCCFACDLKHKSLENCMVHLHKQHGFFIPDIEYLKDPKGLLVYVGLKVTRDFVCLYCNDRCLPFVSLEAVRKHMLSKNHCKLHYGDGGDDEEVELEEFYDYSSSYVDGSGKQLVSVDDVVNTVELGSDGSELIITSKTDGGMFIKTLGSREYLRYYRQNPRPSPSRDKALALSLASRYRSMGLDTVQSKEQMVKMKILREMNRSGVDAMRSKIGMKSNVIRNLPKNVTY